VHRLLLGLWRLFPPSLQDRAANVLYPRLNVGVVAIILRHRTHVLLAEHTYKQAPWHLQEGYLGRGEQPAEGLRRVLAEELGYQMETCRLLHAEGNRRRRLLTLYSLVEAGGTFRPSVEVVRPTVSVRDLTLRV
jgi:ADP-ribose pyrophosphatase YjhB (NUDIX family)